MGCCLFAVSCVPTKYCWAKDSEPSSASRFTQLIVTALAAQDVLAGRRHVAILGIEPVGSYAIRISFDDLHASGLYSWDFLHTLGRQKFARMRKYLERLREAGQSRGPVSKPRRR